MKPLFNIVICDDDADFVKKLHNRITDILDKNSFHCRIVELYDGSELFDYCKKNIADIVFADIDMPNMTGFEAIKKLQEQQPEMVTVFVTAHEELAYQAYDYHPYQFISKKDLGKLENVVKRLIKKIIYRKQSKEVAHIQLANNIIDIRVDEVMYFRSKRNYVLVFNTDGSYSEMRANLKSIYEQLCGTGFIQVNRSYVVNCRFIFDFRKTMILLKDHTEISVTRNPDMRKEAQEQYGRFKRELRW